MSKESLRHAPIEQDRGSKREARPAVLIIDQSHLVRPMIRELDFEGFDASVSESLQEANEFVLRYPTSIIVADSETLSAGFDGIRLLGKPFIVTGNVENDEDVSGITIQALNSGADFFLRKPIEQDVLPAFIRAALRYEDQRKDLPTIYGSNGVSFDPTSRRLFINENEIRLSRTEFDFLNYISQNSGEVLTKQSLIRHIWGSEEYGNSHHLNILIYRIRQKFNNISEGSGDVIESVRGIGYKFRTVNGD